MEDVLLQYDSWRHFSLHAECFKRWATYTKSLSKLKAKLQLKTSHQTHPANHSQSPVSLVSVSKKCMKIWQTAHDNMIAKRKAFYMWKHITAARKTIKLFKRLNVRQSFLRWKRRCKWPKVLSLQSINARKRGMTRMRTNRIFSIRCRENWDRACLHNIKHTTLHRSVISITPKVSCSAATQVPRIEAVYAEYEKSNALAILCNHGKQAIQHRSMFELSLHFHRLRVLHIAFDRFFLFSSQGSTRRTTIKAHIHQLILSCGCANSKVSKDSISDCSSVLNAHGLGGKGMHWHLPSYAFLGGRYHRHIYEVFLEYISSPSPEMITRAIRTVNFSRYLKRWGYRVASRITSRIRFRLGRGFSLDLWWRKLKAGSMYRKNRRELKYFLMNYRLRMWWKKWRFGCCQFRQNNRRIQRNLLKIAKSYRIHKWGRVALRLWYIRIKSITEPYRISFHFIGRRAFTIMTSWMRLRRSNRHNTIHSTLLSQHRRLSNALSTWYLYSRRKRRIRRYILYKEKLLSIKNEYISRTDARQCLIMFFGEWKSFHESTPKGIVRKLLSNMITIADKNLLRRAWAVWTSRFQKELPSNSMLSLNSAEQDPGTVQHEENEIKNGVYDIEVSSELLRLAMSSGVPSPTLDDECNDVAAEHGFLTVGTHSFSSEKYHTIGSTSRLKHETPAPLRFHSNDRHSSTVNENAQEDVMSALEMSGRFASVFGSRGCSPVENQSSVEEIRDEHDSIGDMLAEYLIEQHGPIELSNRMNISELAISSETSDVNHVKIGETNEVNHVKPIHRGEYRPVSTTAGCVGSEYVPERRRCREPVASAAIISNSRKDVHDKAFSISHFSGTFDEHMHDYERSDHSTHPIYESVESIPYISIIPCKYTVDDSDKWPRRSYYESYILSKTG